MSTFEIIILVMWDKLKLIVEKNNKVNVLGGTFT
jgi:hypothetical protein